MEQQDFRTFRNALLKNQGQSRHAKIKDSMGVYDFYKMLRKNHWPGIGKPVQSHDFYRIVRGINKLLAQEIVLGNIVKFPCRMGQLELRRIKLGVRMKKGKLRISYPINWDKTLKLWYEDEEAKQQKILLRDEDKNNFSVKYKKRAANYSNKIYYQFQVNREIKVALVHRMKEGLVESLYEGV